MNSEDSMNRRGLDSPGIEDARHWIKCLCTCVPQIGAPPNLLMQTAAWFSNTCPDTCSIQSWWITPWTVSPELVVKNPWSSMILSCVISWEPSKSLNRMKSGSDSSTWSSNQSSASANCSSGIPGILCESLILWCSLTSSSSSNWSTHEPTEETLRL